MTNTPHSDALKDRTVALPETRQLDVLANLLQERGATVVRCPLVAILDAPDEAPVLAWVRRMIAQPFDLLIIYTGEGVYRLLRFAERAGLRREFVDALRETTKLVRGPKPGRALRTLDMKAEIDAVSPTTDGLIETLETMNLDKQRVGVQLYGAEPNEPLMSYLRSRGAEPDCVAPYVYASASDDARVVELIHRMSAGEIDAIAFTSKSQVERLNALAGREELTDELSGALDQMTVAAVGPVVANELKEAAIRVDVMPERAFFMKPLVTELAEALQGRPR